MTKVVCFINSLSNGGAETQICHLANQLVERGYEVVMATYADLQDLRPLSPKVNRYRISPGAGKWGKFIGIFKFFLTVKTDCVISFCQRNNLVSLIPLFFRSRRIKVIAGERNNTFGKPTWKELSLVHFLYRRADFIVSNSYSQRKHILSLNPKLEKKTLTIINYTDLTLFNVHEAPVNDKYEIGVFCRYDMQKNVIRVSHVAKRLVENGHTNFIIRWYGLKTSKGTMQRAGYRLFKRTIEEDGVCDYFELNDYVSNVNEKIRDFDILCVPSLYEGFSNSIAEAICSGKPMIVSDVSDNSLMVREGQNGFLFDPKDEVSMYNAFERLFSTSKKELVEMGERSRQIAEELFPKNSFIDSYLSLIES